MTEQDNELIVAKVAEQIKETYTLLRTNFCTFPYIPRDTDEDKWTKIAKTCVLYKIPPKEFVEVSFKALAPFPYINQLLGEGAVKRFMDTRQSAARSTVSDVMIQLSALEKLMGIGRSVEDLFTDSLQNFDPLFKYIVSKHYGMEDMASVFYDDAVVTYVMMSTYLDAAYKDLIPEELKGATGKVRKYANG